jgi:hypothetical protein
MTATWIRRAVLSGVALSGLLYSWAAERTSLERANRLYREGALQEASDIYGREASGDGQGGRAPIDPAVRYNLGTSLLELGSAAAEGELLAAAEGWPLPTAEGESLAADEGESLANEEGAARDAIDEVRARALYNAGLFSLRRALDGAEGDSLRMLATAAVDANRSALRVRPDHADTKWNLAMAQRLLDSIQAGDRDAGEESAESALEADEVMQSQNVLEVDEESELPEDAPMDGEDETRADLNDDGPMSELEAAEILTGSHYDPALLVRKLLALQSRGFWGRRPAARGPRR